MVRIAFLILAFSMLSCSYYREKKANEQESKDLCDKAIKLFETGDYKQALALSLKAARLDDENYVAHNNVAVSKYKLGYPREDIEVSILFSLELNSKYTYALNSAMTLYFDNRQYEKVLRYASKYQELQDFNKFQLNTVGESYRMVKDFRRADSLLRKALELDSTYWTAAMNLGEVYLDRSKPDEALEYFAQARRFNKNYPGLYNDIGLAYYLINNFDSALVNVNKALHIKVDTSYLINKGTYLIKMDSIDSGCACFARAESMGRPIEEITGDDYEAMELNSKYCKPKVKL